MKTSFVSRSPVILLCCLALLGGCAPRTEPKPVVQAPVEEKTIDRAATLIAQQLVAGVPADRKPKTAVLDLTDLAGHVSEFGRLAQEEISAKLSMTGKVGTVERLKLNEMLGELALQQSGVVNEATAKRVGQQLGVDAVVAGTVVDLNAIAKLNVRLIDVEKGNILAWGSAEVTKDAAISRLMAQRLSGTGSASGSSSSRDGSPATGPMLHKVEQKSFSFELQECKKKGGGITCALLVTNLEDDSDLTIFGTGSFPQSRLFDTRGHVYEARVRVGHSHEENNVTVKLVKGMPTALTLNFEKVSADVSGIALLEVGCIERGGSRVTAQFRNVPLGQ